MNDAGSQGPILLDKTTPLPATPNSREADRPVLLCEAVGKSYGRGAQTVNVLEQVNLQVMPRERVAIVGASGSGKSTLLHLLGGLDQASSGTVQIMGQTVGTLRQRALGKLRNRALGFVYQFHHLLPEFSAVENVAMPLLIRGMSRPTAQTLASTMLERVGLGQRLTHKPGELSGGERQRAAIARALVTQPAVVLADEPTGNLDPHTADRVWQVFLDVQATVDAALVFVTHDMELASRCDRILRLVDGRLVEERAGQ